MAIPDFRADGFLPEGVHDATIDEVVARFGAQNERRRRLAAQLVQWIDLSKAVGIIRILVAGSFVTSKARPVDLDAVVLLPADFAEQVAQGRMAALQLSKIMTDRQPSDLFPADDWRDWRSWCEFFAKSREENVPVKGMVQIWL
jgi:hypothetical protein